MCAGVARRGFAADSRGAAALEFAILAPVFLLFCAGMLAYAIYFGAAHSLQQLAADAARISVAGLTPAERDALVQHFLDQNAGGYLLIDRNRLAFQLSTAASDPTEYSVVLRYDASALPIWNLYLPLPLPSHTLTYSSVIRMGGM